MVVAAMSTMNKMRGGDKLTSRRGWTHLDDFFLRWPEEEAAPGLDWGASSSELKKKEGRFLTPFVD